MAKATSIKDALKRWEEKHEQIATEATEILLCFQWPPIEKMDNTLATLTNCTRLSLSTNMIEKIAGVGRWQVSRAHQVGNLSKPLVPLLSTSGGIGNQVVSALDYHSKVRGFPYLWQKSREEPASGTLKNLKILSLGRNYIKSFAGLEGIGDTLEELWISYNLIEKLKGINVLRNLKVLYMSNNLVREWPEFNKLQELPLLEDLLFVGNPLHESMEESAWKAEVPKRLPNLKKLDGEPVINEEVPQMVQPPDVESQSEEPSQS